MRTNSHQAADDVRPPVCTCGAGAPVEEETRQGVPVLADLLSALDHLKADFEKRLVGIVPADPAHGGHGTQGVQGVQGAPVEVRVPEDLDLLRPFADHMPARLRGAVDPRVGFAVERPRAAPGHGGAAHGGAPAQGAPSLPTPGEKRFCALRLDLPLDAFAEPILLRRPAGRDARPPAHFTRHG